MEVSNFYFRPSLMPGSSLDGHFSTYLKNLKNLYNTFKAEFSENLPIKKPWLRPPSPSPLRRAETARVCFGGSNAGAPGPGCTAGAPAPWRGSWGPPGGPACGPGGQVRPRPSVGMCCVMCNSRKFGGGEGGAASKPTFLPSFASLLQEFGLAVTPPSPKEKHGCT